MANSQNSKRRLPDWGILAAIGTGIFLVWTLSKAGPAFATEAERRRAQRPPGQ